MRVIIAFSDAGGADCSTGSGVVRVSGLAATGDADAGTDGIGIGGTAATGGDAGVVGAGCGVSVSARTAAAAGFVVSAMAMRSGGTPTCSIGRATGVNGWNDCSGVGAGSAGVVAAMAGMTGGIIGGAVTAEMRVWERAESSACAASILSVEGDVAVVWSSSPK